MTSTARRQMDVTTLGELMLRLSVPAGERLSDADRLDLHVGGAEANVAAGLAALGHRVFYATALPDTPLGHLAARRLRAAGVPNDGIAWKQSGRIGTYYVEFAAPPRAIQVVYDRADSCASAMTPDDLDFDRLLDTRLLHLTGITPALSPSCALLTQTTVERARAAGIPYSLDVNHRSRLWGERAAADMLAPLMHGAAVLFCKADDARLFGIAGAPPAIARELRARFAADWVIVSAGEHGVYACDGQDTHQPALPTQIVDRLGAGDALAAGVLHGWLLGHMTRALAYGAVMAALALSQHGDMVMTDADEVNALVTSSARGIIR